MSRASTPAPRGDSAQTNWKRCQGHRVPGMCEVVWKSQPLLTAFILDHLPPSTSPGMSACCDPCRPLRWGQPAPSLPIHPKHQPFGGISPFRTRVSSACIPRAESSHFPSPCLVLLCCYKAVTSKTYIHAGLGPDRCLPARCGSHGRPVARVCSIPSE